MGWHDVLTAPGGAPTRSGPPSGARAAHLALTAPGPSLAGRPGAPEAPVRAARERVAAAVGLPPERVLYPEQVHGAGVAVVDGPWAGPPPQVDALVTDRPGLALAVVVADCVPVLLADPAAGVVGVAHAGRRGMDAGVALAALAAMGELGATSVRAVLGPSVCARCYEVPAAMRDDVAGRHPLTASLSWRGAPALDVAAGVLAQLVGAGVEVVQRPGCTVERHELGSVRRAGPDAARQAGIAWLAP